MTQPTVKLKNNVGNNIIELDDFGRVVDYRPDDNFDKYVNYENKKALMQEKIIEHNDDLWYPSLETKLNKTDKVNSWFSIFESDSKKIPYVEGEYNFADKEKVKYKSKEIVLKLTRKQKHIINTWLNAYLDMYNIAIKYIKDNIKTDGQVLNFKYVRGKLLNQKREIINRFNKIITRKSKNISIKVHDIDYAIKLACSNWKSAISNLKAGNIKHFRIRYWRRNKPTKILDLEKNDFESGSIRKAILGQIKGFYNGKLFDLSVINCDCRIKREKDKYYLYVPEHIDLEDIKSKMEDKKDEEITIDLGIRRFGTGITENKIVKIGENCEKRIKEYLIRKDKIMNNDEINEEIKKKNENMINKKIKNLVTELHWKTINYLIKKYKTILIGDLSAKGIVSKQGNLYPMSKRIAMSLSYYTFRQRLKYKCDVNNVNYGLVNEWMTSKMCSRCGEINEELKGKKIFKCEECNLTIDRDINGARNINIKARK